MKTCMQGLLGGGTMAKTVSVGTHFLGPNNVSFIYTHFNLRKKSEAKIGLETTGEILKFSLSRVTAQKIRVAACGLKTSN